MKSVSEGRLWQTQQLYPRASASANVQHTDKAKACVSPLYVGHFGAQQQSSTPHLEGCVQLPLALKEPLCENAVFQEVLTSFKMRLVVFHVASKKCKSFPNCTTSKTSAPTFFFNPDQTLFVLILI
jgi:hypothetical protein